jgi:hypothetical protein
LNLLSYPRANQQVIGRVIDTEAVLVHPQAGKIKVINETGALIWQLCDGQHSVAQIIDAVCLQYQVEAGQAEADTMQFLEALAQRGLLSE